MGNTNKNQESTFTSTLNFSSKQIFKNQHRKNSSFKFNNTSSTNFGTEIKKKNEWIQNFDPALKLNTQPIYEQKQYLFDDSDTEFEED